MANREGDAGSLITDGLHHCGCRMETHKMHRADFGLVAVSPFKLTVDDIATGTKTYLLSVIQPHEKVEPVLHRIGIRELDQQGGAQFSGGREECIIHIQLLLDLLRIDNFLDTNHLLNLKPERLSIFEYQCDLVTDGDAPTALQGDDGLAVRITLSLVLILGDQVILCQKLHRLTNRFALYTKFSAIAPQAIGSRGNP
jgi:hypothetical protein